MSKQTLIGSLQLDLAKLQALPEAEMKNVLNQLDDILLNIEEPEVVEKLKSIIADIKSADVLMKVANDFAREFLVVNYGDEKARVKLKEIWNNQNYEEMYKGAWVDLKKIKDACCILVGTLEHKENIFDTYCEDYLNFFKKYMKTDRLKTNVFNNDEETPDRFRDSVTTYIKQFSKEDVPYNNHCNKKILSLVNQ